MAIFSEQDKQRIEARIGEAEKATAAEIVVATVARSDHYGDVRLGLALALALGGSAALHLALPHLPVGELLLAQVALAGVGFWLSGVHAVLRRLIAPARGRAMVQREAELRFLEHALFATRDRNGVLILLSELEHTVSILGDQGIHTRVQNAGWEKHVATITAAIRSGRSAEGVCEVIGALEQQLGQLEPIREGDTNELDNRVRTHG